EVVGHLARTGHEEVAISALLSDLPLIIVPPDAAVAMIAGLMRPITAAVGLSLGDRFCLALAKRSEAIAVTADRAWAKLGAMLGVEVELVR
ncbi:MAG: PIN domain-containing protein, partial [Caulobacteraceae bacterium]